MNDERALVVPTGVVSIGTRALEVPRGRRALCVSCILAFRIEDGAPVDPRDWYGAVAAHAGPMAIPDSTAPLPGAEVLVLGPVGPVSEEPSRARLAFSGGFDVELVLRSDAADPSSGPTLRADFERAVHHPEHNPQGRDPDADPPPAVLLARDAREPVWLGATPFDHPLRVRAAGSFADFGQPRGWPPDADPWVLGETHPLFRCERIDPGATLSLEGLFEDGIRREIRVPAYRIALTSAWRAEEFRSETMRIHTLAVIPAAGVAAAIWRASLGLSDGDGMGEEIGALIIGVEDAGATPHDADHWAQIAMGRWINPEEGLDDRPLLPPSLHHTVTLPFVPPGPDDPIAARHAAAQDWAKDQAGFPGENPFAERVPSAQKAIERAQAIDGREDEPPSADAMAGVADDALELARERHRAAGFDPEARPPATEPLPRGMLLAAEIAKRLRAPFGSESERRLAQSAEHLRPELEALGADPSEVDPVERIARVRVMSPAPVLMWRTMPDEEAARFGAAFVASLAESRPFPFLDLSGAHIVPSPSGNPSVGHDAEEGLTITAESFVSLLGEYVKVEHVTFTDCDFTDATLCGAQFAHCTFVRCTFTRTNLSKASFAYCRFVESPWTELHLIEPTWGETRFEDCEWNSVQASDVAASDLAFEGGSLENVQITDALWIRATMRGMRWSNVTLMDVHAPECLLEDLDIEKLWVTTKGFSKTVFRDVRADTCGFLSLVRFDHGRLERSRFTRCGFTRAVFNEVEIAPSCRFEECDFTSALFHKTVLDGARFARSTFVTSMWRETSAREAWFLACSLLSVDMRGVELLRAVFTDSDMEATQLDFERTIGADFRGTVLEGR